MKEIKDMSMEEFARLCNRLVSEMGFKVKHSVYREDTVVMDATMPVPGKEMHYIIIFLRRERIDARDIKELVDFETLQIRWLIITTGEIDESAKKIIPANMDITLIDGKEFERMLSEYGLLREKREEISYLPSVGEVDNLLSWAEEFYKNGNYRRALEYVNRALSIKTTPRILKMKVRILHALGKYDESLSILKNLLVNNIKDDEAWFLLGSVLESMGRGEEAEEAYGQCVRFNPRHIGCWLNRGNILFSQEKMEEALICYENALKIRQDLPQVWNNRGVVLKYLGKLDEAMRSYNAALKYDDKFADAYLNKAILFYEMRRYEEAENSLAQYLKLKEDAEGYVLLANIYLKRQLLSRAEEAAKKALSIDPTNLEAKKILRKVYGGKVKDIEMELKRGIEDILNILPEEEMEPVREILKEAKSLVSAGDLEAARNKLEEAKRMMREFADHQKLKDTIISDILELSSEGGVELPSNLDELDVEELNRIRRNLINRLRELGARAKARDELLKSLNRIRMRMQSSGILSDELNEKIREVENLIEAGNFPDAMELLLEISAGVEKKKYEEMRNIIIEDTKELLEDAGVEAPENLEGMDFNEIKRVRLSALEKIKGEKVKEEIFKGNIRDEIIGDIRELSSYANVEIDKNLEEMSIDELKSLRKEIIEKIKSMRGKSKGSVEEPGLKEFVNVLQGASRNNALRKELIEDIKKLSALLNEEVDENVESMDIESLRQLKERLLEKVSAIEISKETRKREEAHPRGFGHVLLQFGDVDAMEINDVGEDEYTSNALGIIQFERGDFEGAIKYFKRALAINPDFKEAEFNLAYSLYKLGKIEDARLHLKHIGIDETIFERGKN